MTIITFAYIILLAIFIIFATFILRHTMKYGHLSARFKIVAAIFGLMAAVIIVFSLYLLVQLYSNPSASAPNLTPSKSTSNDLNF